jgi:hypothetical protein
MAIEIDTPWTAAAKVAEDLIDRFVPDKAEASRQKLEAIQQIGDLQKAQLAAATAVDVAQSSVNAAEAQQRSFWTSGARPSILWICSAGLGYAVIAQPVLGWVMVSAYHWPPPPSLDMGTIMTLLVPMLGLSTQRTIERINGAIPPGK